MTAVQTPARQTTTERPGRYEQPATVPRDGLAASRDGLAASRRRELAAFLRSRRERISPEQVGLPPGGRRRTPGLRREEVALLAGVGVTWYTWLEQGRSINVSPQVLDAIARTLQLDRHERAHLFTLADSPVTAAQGESNALPGDVQSLLDQLHPFPACVVNARYDVLAFNRAYSVVSGDLDALPPDERNLLWLAFVSPARRAMLVDWEQSVRRMVGLYRAAMADHVGEPAWRCFVQRLEAASPEFVELWRRHEVIAPENCNKRMLHPDLGLLTFTYTNLWLTPRTGTRMMVFRPGNEATTAALARVDEVAAPPL